MVKISLGEKHVKISIEKKTVAGDESCKSCSVVLYPYKERFIPIPLGSP